MEKVQAVSSVLASTLIRLEWADVLHFSPISVYFSLRRKKFQLIKFLFSISIQFRFLINQKRPFCLRLSTHTPFQSHFTRFSFFNAIKIKRSNSRHFLNGNKWKLNQNEREDKMLFPTYVIEQPSNAFSIITKATAKEGKHFIIKNNRIKNETLK